MLPVIAGGAALGALGGMFSKGPEIQLSQYGIQGQQNALDAMNAYKNLVGVGPGAKDITASLDATRGFANQLNNIASSSQGLYDMSRGNVLAEQMFGAQRVAMNQGFQDQLQQANRAATAAGRSSNDPILRARLAQDQTRQQQLLMAQQSAAAVDLGRQATLDTISLQGQRVSQLQGLANQAYTGQQNLYNMGSQALQQDFSRALGTAQYEQSRGGGLQGAITGALGGAAAGFNIAQGMQGLANQKQMLGMMGGMQGMMPSANSLAAMAGSGVGSWAAGSMGAGAGAPAAMSMPTAPAPMMDMAGGTTPYSSSYLSMPNFAYAQNMPTAPASSARLGNLPSTAGPATAGSGNWITNGLSSMFGWMVPGNALR